MLLAGLNWFAITRERPQWSDGIAVFLRIFDTVFVTDKGYGRAFR
jgi:hypothetical protein